MQSNVKCRSPQERRRRSAEYVRMSTKHEQNPSESKVDRIRDYATHNDIGIVRTYADEGRSRLNIGGSEGLHRLIADRRTKNTAFELILVYDASRWGGSRTPMRAFTTSIAASRQGYMSSSMPSS